MLGIADLRKPVWWGVGGLILVSAAVLIYSWRTGQHAAHAPTPAKAPPPPVAAAPPVQNPVPPPAAGATSTPLPDLVQSDAPVQQALSGVLGAPAMERLIRPEMIVRHFVATVDNLSRKRASVEQWPVKPVAGQFKIRGDDQHATIDPVNYQRYTPYVQLLQTLDTKQLVDTYFHFYPLFQQAYQSLGYPNGYFNDRMVETIDHLLQTPDVSGEIALVRPNVMYQYADPALEGLSAGQKVLLRMGPGNEAVVKAKLRELRSAIGERSRGATRERSGN